ncbi:MAG: threonylcarbamoyl-AMP synthase [Candidatus Yanofskybacteria bacterium RIFCSPLOWO2_02_FULL_43_10]|uniref:L-threonylcarbamoyladenylate synthase n=1 Tax=Candidatus Yanofskybacteria bacterium RIFCSPLOWO2_12_FULL_43_11b TaxID=1802710 RepID=A0A1F8H9S4_9BACT|nr:MAG: threonylcarbamoyl-AMP synthase [Candidatus Yanofskybacteria bacterium RIFCSPHIGHO2_01_FULL_43_32]OGN11517.1 MAG: threonylcarbamoyl-AMP synthase [Candidatus Yanofskybacteria bacterium RIFCSPHIGHO2_02_FULL_43_12]OGN18402.1 MAG: threonylcarbamoyl-AMP synthase [Candidatus Yanofskybacteria bacterium RIFCSPHIGHO2_12_FULL_43_11]OGN24853.1 MAG: threonylcarbamoyl-AMP synthase [Candidatus Yanofskybacteria bacterium RIFCSPLOWO2_01_FULL_43_46]OGN29615.1 MAG: threonylcarbamoyl-AMP synthase [Candidat
MKTIQVDLNKNYSNVIREAVNVLNYGGTIVYPTDTLYGLGANVLNEIAVKKVFRIKERSFSKPLPMIVRNHVWVKELAEVKPRHEEIMKKVWPGKVTVVLFKKEIVPGILTAEFNSVGIRIPDYVFTDKLLGKFGYPLTSTSANISGQEPTNDINKIVEIFSKSTEKPDLIIDAGILPKSEPSMIIDLTGDKPKVLRISPTKPEKLLELLELGGK